MNLGIVWGLLGKIILSKFSNSFFMNTTRFMGITTTILSITLMALFVQPSLDISQNAFADKDSMKMMEQIQTQDNVSLKFSFPETIMAGKLVPINAVVVDANRAANLSHTDWSYAVIGPNGEVVHKSTTLHGHFGVMNFKDSFPEAGTYTVKYTVSSSGPFMLGMPVPELGQTRAVVSGDLLKFEEDPTNNFGSRSYEFTIDVMNQGRTITLDSDPNAPVTATLTTQPERIVVGHPTTLIIDVDDANTGEDATHVDGQITIRRGNYYASASGDQPDIPVPIPLHGAYHGHLGTLSVTHTFPQPGTYMIATELNPVPYSVPLFAPESVRFSIQVFENGMVEVQQEQTVKENTVNVVGLEAPFYAPNTIHVSLGETITFDNMDGNHHTVTSVKSGTIEHDGKFDSGLLQAGENYELTLYEKGTYHYYCALHTSMQGTIIVS